MKICIVGYGNEDGTRSWTDVALTIKKTMEIMGHDVEYFRWKGLVKHLYIDKAKRFINHWIYMPATLRDPGIYRINARKFKRLLCNKSADSFLFMGEQCLNGNITKKSHCYAYIDNLKGPIAHVSEKGKVGLDSFYKCYEKNDARSLNYCRLIFTQNEWSRQYIINNYGIDANKIINVGFGIYTEYYEGAKDYTNHRILIILRKGLERTKGLDLLLGGFKIAKKTIPDLQLDVVGTEYTKVEGVNYYYNMPRSKTLELYKEDALYAMPALYESNGITYLEALANKMPILGLNRFAFPEFSGNGEYGFMAETESDKDVAEAIIKAFSDENTLKEMGEQGQRFVRTRYDWEMVVDKMLKYMLCD